MDNENVKALGAKIIADNLIRIEEGTIVHDELKTAYLVFSRLMK